MDIYRTNQKKRMKTAILNIKQFWFLYLMLIPPIIYIIVFAYIPMAGLQIAFKEFDPSEGFFGGEWVGLENFQRFFDSYDFWNIVKNTVGVSLYSMIAGFPIPIILAISLNETANIRWRKIIQFVTYAPHFISTVVLVSIVAQLLSPHVGIINNIMEKMGHETVNFMGRPQFFQTIFVWSGVWQSTGYSAIIYIAALTTIDLQLYDSAIVDGAGKLQKIWYIDIPGIMPTAVILLILNAGRIMSVGFEKVYLMQNSLNISASEVISTYVYKVGLVNTDFSFSTAVGLFNSVINLMLIVLVNQLAKKFGETSLW